MSRPLDLTSGSIPTQMARLSAPLLMANLLQQLYNILNSMVVSRTLGEDAFAALGVAESLMNLYIFVIIGACLGVSVLVARFYGEGDHPRLRREIYVGAILVGGSTLVAVVAGVALLPQILRLIQTPQALMDLTCQYLYIILPGMLFSFLYNYLAAILRAVGNTRAALLFLLSSLVYNLAASLFLVVVAGLGIRGTAIATTTAQALSAGLCLLYIWRRQPALRLGRADLVLDRALLAQTVSYSSTSSLQQSSLFLGKLLIQGQVNDLGTTAISAFAAACRVENFVQAFGTSGSETIAIFVAQNQGAKRPRRARRGFWLGMAVMAGLGVVSSVIMHFFPQTLLAPFLGGGTGESLSLGRDYLSVMGLFYLLSFGGFSFVGWFRGTGRMGVAFWASAAQIAVRVAGTFLLIGRLGLPAVAWSTGVGWMLVIVMHVAFYLHQRRKETTLNEDG